MNSIVKTHFPIFKSRGCRQCHTSGIKFKPMWVVYNDMYTTYINGAIFRHRVYVCKSCSSTKHAVKEFYHRYMDKVLKKLRLR